MNGPFNSLRVPMAVRARVLRKVLATGAAVLVPVASFAQSNMSAMDQQGMSNANARTEAAASMDHSKMSGMAAGATKDADMKMDMGAKQGGAPPSDARDPDVYSNGLSLGPMDGMDMADHQRHGQVLLDRLEATHSNSGNGQALDAQAWYGSDLDKLWLKVDGERSNGKLGATRTEALWNHAIAPYWGLQTGIRHDFGDGPGRTWAAIGVQGLSPYWFGVQATAYVGQGGRTAARLEAEYDILLTQRLVLQPNAKLSLYGRNDPERGIGSGLSDIEAGLRLRYEVSRKFAPYIGVVWKGKLGQTADYARESGHAVRETQVVGGVRMWF